MATFPPYQAAGPCRDTGMGATNMLYWLDRESPWREVGYNLGVGNCRTIAGKPTRSVHGERRAWDLGLPLVKGRANPIGHQIVGELLPLALQLGIQALIFDRTIWSAKSPRGARYTGVHPHYDHIHGEHTYEANARLNVPTIRVVTSRGGLIVPASPPPVPSPAPESKEDDDDMANYIRLDLKVGSHPHAGRIEAVTAMHRRWVPGNEYNLFTYLGGKTIQCNREQFNAWTSNKAPLGTNQINGPL